VDGGAKVAFFRRGRVCTPETIGREVHPDEVQTMTAHLKAVLPSLPGRLLRAVTCLYTNTPDQHFVIGTHPQHPQVTVACGFSGHGFKFVPVIGEVLADLVTTGSTAHPIALFDPRRQFVAPAKASPEK
jgi:sarcosine oxidase